VAANITVAPLPEVTEVEGPFRLLSDLEMGEESVVMAIGDECRGLTRRRLLDLGFTPGARIELERTGPFGDPRAYKVRGTLIALRHEQADHILVEPAVQAADREDDV
jgi:DtxR family Mn-dependent transcriptional regulator